MPSIETRVLNDWKEYQAVEFLDAVVRPLLAFRAG